MVSVGIQPLNVLVNVSFLSFLFLFSLENV